MGSLQIFNIVLLLASGVDEVRLIHISRDIKLLASGVCAGVMSLSGVIQKKKSFVQYILTMIQISSNIPLLASGFLRWVDALLWL